MRIALRILLPLLALAVGISCNRLRFAELDNLLDEKDAIDAEVKWRTDSLRAIYDSLPWEEDGKWEATEALYKEWRHLNLDSSVFYTTQMLRLAGDDPSRVLRSRAAQVRNLVRAEELSEADSVFSSIVLPPDASPEDCDAYFYSAERLNNYLPFPDKNELRRRLNSLSEDFLRRDSSAVKAQLMKVKALRFSGPKEKALDYLRTHLQPERIADIYDLSSYYIAGASLYLEIGRPEEAIDYALKAACVDLRSGMKDYFSLYLVSQLLFDRGDKRRASRYMNRAVQDALEYNYPVGVRRSARASALMTSAIQQISRNQRLLLVAAVAIVSVFLAITLFLWLLTWKSLGKVRTINRKYKASQQTLRSVSLIKDRMLGEYMGLASSYIYKVDENKSKYRKILKEKGADALLAVFREPNYADAEYPHFWNNFDKIFLSIFPDFVAEVNRLMQPDKVFEVGDGPNALTTELRILALIRLGITESARIANILHISRGTVYTYRCVMRQNALKQDSFEQNIQAIGDL